MADNTPSRSAGTQLGELRASLDGLRQKAAAASPAEAGAAAKPVAADLLAQAMAALPALIEYAGVARALLGSRRSAGGRAEVPRSVRPGLGRRLRRYALASLALGGCYLAYRLMRPATRQDDLQFRQSRTQPLAERR